MDPSRATRLTCWAHLVLAAQWLLWQLLESTPRTSALYGTSFATTGAGRALALLTLCVGVAALVAIVRGTLRARRDGRLWLLLAALALALAWRATIDVFDLVWLGLLAVFAADALRRRPAASPIRAGAAARPEAA